jgi:hypothetical protein
VTSIKRFTSKSGLDANSLTITNVANPVSDQDAVTKYYVDNVSGLSGLSAETAARVAADLDPILTRTTGHGIKVDSTTPTFPWRDLVGQINYTGQSTDPVMAAFRGGNILRCFFGNNDTINLEYHIPHDYLPGSDIFLHIHWGHNGTAISGNLVIQTSMTFAKGFNQQIFPAETVFTWTIPATNLTVAPRWGHVVSEVQITAQAPTASQLQSSTIEVDGEMLVHLKMTTLPNISGGTQNKPYIGHVDLHYQSTGVGTKNKAPDFY